MSRTERVSQVRSEWREAKPKRKNNKPETIFRDVLREIAPLYNCLLIAIPDFIHAKGNKIVAHKRPCDDILVTSHGNYLIEAKYGNNPLLTHQKETMRKVNSINKSCYALRKKVLKKGTFYTVEQPEKVVLFKTEKIEELFEYFKDPNEYNSQSIMLDHILPHTKRKFKRRVRG